MIYLMLQLFFLWVQLFFVKRLNKIKRPGDQQWMLFKLLC